MKIVRFQMDEKVLWGMLDADATTIHTNIDIFKNIDSFSKVIDVFKETSENSDILNQEVSRMDVKLLAPVMPTKNILCIGKNYYDHILEFDGNDDDVERVKEMPIFFSKALSSVTGPYELVYLHENACSHVDYEAELAVIIGKQGINIEREDALDYIYGYTVLNDVTSRDLQSNHQQWYKGKSLDSHCPIGPWIVTKDEIDNGNNLHIQSIINGEVRQDSNTSLMIHDIKALIVQLSKGMTLNPGDIIATGTPKGVGKGFNPPKYLKQGDEMEINVEGIGSLVNKVASSVK